MCVLLVFAIDMNSCFIYNTIRLPDQNVGLMNGFEDFLGFLMKMFR